MGFFKYGSVLIYSRLGSTSVFCIKFLFPLTNTFSPSAVFLLPALFISRTYGRTLIFFTDRLIIECGHAARIHIHMFFAFFDLLEKLP